MLPVVWVLCAVAIITAAVRSRRHPDAVRTGRIAVGFLYVVAGAAVNVFFLLRGDDYGEFADSSSIPYVRDTWRSVVVPNHDVWISLLIVFELLVGVLAVSGGRRTQVAYAAAIVFHIALAELRLGLLPLVGAHGRRTRDAPARRAPMNWRELDFATRAGVVAAAMAVLGLVIPPLGLSSALVAIAFSSVGWRRSHRRGQPNPVALFCIAGCVALVIMVVGGSALYAAG